MSNAAVPPRVLFARQAIVDRDGRLEGYELLYRGERDADGTIPDAEHATCQVLVGAFAEVGIAAAVGGRTAFLNVTENFLHAVDPLPLDPATTVLELLEDAIPSPPLLDRLAALRAAGFRVALDDFVRTPASEAFLDVADLVKVDLRMHGHAGAERLISDLTERGLVVVAEKVEHEEEFLLSAAAGAQLFQGWFFCRPVELAGAELRAASLSRLRLAAGLTSPDVTLEDIEAVVSTDPALSLRLLRYLNSAALSLRQRVSSVHHAVTLLGPRKVRQWLLVLLMSGVGEQRGPVLSTALARARTCQLLGEQRGADDAEAWFSVGLLSVADVLAGSSMDAVLAELPLADDVAAALRGGEGPKGEALAAAIACERGELPQHDRALALAAYGDAAMWADAHAMSA